MFFRQGLCDPGPVFPGAAQIPPGIFRKQHIHQIHLGDPGGDGAGLEGIFVGTALEHDVRKLRAGGLGEPGDENGLDAPGFGKFQYFLQKRKTLLN